MSPASSRGLASRIALLGLRGSGKTTVGRLLAARLGVPWHDTDHSIAATTLASPAELLSSGRIAELRAAECRVVAELSQLTAAVISLGGGAVESPEVLAALHDWRAFLLDAPDAELARRIAGDPSPRPPLTDRTPLEEIAILRERRFALYTALDPVIIATAFRSPTEIVDEILIRLAEGEESS